MSERKDKRRTSILKKRRSTEDETTETTFGKIQKRTHFSQKNQVKEFMHCEEKTTIWGSTYETSVAKSEGSSDNSSNSRRISVDFSNSTYQHHSVTTKNVSSILESEKENIISERTQENVIPANLHTNEDTKNHNSENTLTDISSTRNSVEITVAFNEGERSRVNKYGTENLNLTQHLDVSLLSNKINKIADQESKKVFSPRKTIFYNKASNLRVIVQDKCLTVPGQNEENVSISIEEDEIGTPRSRPTRKTINKPVDMNITAQKTNISLDKNKIISSIPKPSPHYSKTIVPNVFKAPRLPSEFKFTQQCYESPPIKPIAIENEKEEMDELLDLMVSDTPNKLCCLGRNHTPRSSAKKVVFSSQRKSTDIFKEIGLIDSDQRDKVKAVRRTILQNNPIEVDENEIPGNSKSQNRNTIYDNVQIDEASKFTKQSRETVFNNDISIEEQSKSEALQPAAPVNDVLLHEEQKYDMEETCTNFKNTNQNAFFELDEHDKSVTAAKSINLVKYKDIPQFHDKRKSEIKLDMQSNDTCNTTNFLMNLTNVDDTGVSLETTEEINRKAARLLENPNSTLGSHHSLNLTMASDIDETFSRFRSGNISKPGISLRPTNMSANMSLENDDSIALDDAENCTSARSSIQKVLFPDKSLSILTQSTEDLRNGESFNLNSAEKEKLTRRTIIQNNSIEIDCDTENSKSFKNYNHNLTKKTDEIANPVKTNRQTVFYNDIYIDPETSSHDDFNIEKEKSTRRTIMQNNSIQIDCNNIPESSKSFNHNSIYQDIDVEEEIPKTNNRKRQTVFASDISIDSGVSSNISVAVNKENLGRKTILKSYSIEIDDQPGTSNNLQRFTIYNDQKDSPKNNKEKRQTVFNQDISIDQSFNCATSEKRSSNKRMDDDMEETCANLRKDAISNQTESNYMEQPSKKQLIETNQSRFHNDKNNETNFLMNLTNVHQAEVALGLSRKSNHMEMDEDETIPNYRSTCISRSDFKFRPTIFDAEMSINSENVPSTSSVSMVKPFVATNDMNITKGAIKNISLNRKTTYEQQIMENNFVIIPENSYMQLDDEKRPEIQSENTSKPEFKYRPTIFDAEMSINSENVPSTSGISVVKPRPTINEDMNITEANDKKSLYRKTIHDQQAMETDERRKTFTVKSKDDSEKWHNITDAELLNMIDDESNPCVSASEEPTTLDEPGNISKYEDALENFMNITINASPFNTTDYKPSASHRVSRVISPVKDYDSMLDNLISDLKKKDNPKPRLEIDDFLEKNKIAPVKIKINPPGYAKEDITKIINQYKDIREERIRLEKELAATQFPQIPSTKFLMKNLLESMESEIARTVEERQNAIPPLFPDAVSFEELLLNKFETDEFLRENFAINTSFWWMRHIKIFHRKLPMFTINFSCEQTPEDADNSTIPILFKKVLLYTSRLYRSDFVKTTRLDLQKKEFKRINEGVSNFTSICGTSKDLFSFLEFYHRNAMEAVELVEKLMLIIHRYKSIIKKHPVLTIYKVQFPEDDEGEFLDVKISLEGYIEDVSIKDICVTSRRYDYVILSRPNINEMKGLMLIEYVLFNLENFLQANAQKIKKEK